VRVRPTPPALEESSMRKNGLCSLCGIVKMREEREGKGREQKMREGTR
jgi:hypothetical protein